MPDPYASVAETYDLMIDWPARLARERPFFAALLPDAAGIRVLDVGCGTGHHSAMFAELGAEVIGLDSSSAMIARARELFSGENPRFVTGSFGDVAHLPGKFDIIAVLGNSLAYVRNGDELTKILLEMRHQLTARGRLCIQLVNYDSLLAEESRWLPLIHRQAGETEYLFLREYQRLGAQVAFTIVTLHNEAGWSQTTERSLHLAITGQLLREGLQQAGFSHIDLYGDFQRALYRPASSGALIAVAAKS